MFDFSSRHGVGLLITLFSLLVATIGFWKHRIQSSARLWQLITLVSLWGAGAALVISEWWLVGLLCLSGFFLFALSIQIDLIKRETSHDAEVARLMHIVEARSDRVTALGHEIRTPLSMIKGSVDLILEGNPGPLTDQQRKFLQTASQNCDHMILLAEDLLVQARIEAGLFKLRLEPVDLKVLAWQAKKAMASMLEERGQNLSLDYPQVMERVTADPRLITQALSNLLQNASRHTSHGGQIYLTIANNDTEVVVSVTDDGAGMSVEERRNLFQKFASGRPLGDGTGLGLVITKQIVELHGGQIMVDTHLGRGTTMLFTLPRWKKENDEQTTRVGR